MMRRWLVAWLTVAAAATTTTRTEARKVAATVGALKNSPGSRRAPVVRGVEDEHYAWSLSAGVYISSVFESLSASARGCGSAVSGAWDAGRGRVREMVSRAADGVAWAARGVGARVSGVRAAASRALDRTRRVLGWPGAWVFGALRATARPFFPWWSSSTDQTLLRLTAGQVLVLEALKASVPDALRRDAVRAGMPLDDAMFARYLNSAGWRLEFRDRSVLAAMEHTVRWRATARALLQSRGRGSNEDDHLAGAVSLAAAETDRGEAVLRVRCSRISRSGRDPDAWRDHLVRSVEGGVRSTRAGTLCILVDARGASSKRLLDAARAMSPAFPTLQTHYPGRLSRVVVLGCGAAGQACWWLMRSILDDQTKAKIAFVPDLGTLARHVKLMNIQFTDLLQVDPPNNIKPAEASS